MGSVLSLVDNPSEISGAIEAFFPGPLRPSKPAPADHYYKPYWTGKA